MTTAIAHNLDQLLAAYAARSATSDTAWHPRWCTREVICDGRHSSTDRTIVTLSGGSLNVNTALDQGLPLVEVTVIVDGNAVTTTAMSPAMTRRLAQALNEAAARHQTA